LNSFSISVGDKSGLGSKKVNKGDTSDIRLFPE
jgi:hypothetical protein